MMTFKSFGNPSYMMQGFDENGQLVAMPMISVNLTVECQDLADLKVKLAALYSGQPVAGVSATID